MVAAGTRCQQFVLAGSSRYPLAPVDADSSAPDGDARIHGEIVTLLMKDVNAISKDLHQQLGTSLTVFAKKNGITTVRSPAYAFIHVVACTVLENLRR